ncbi:MAG: hypothetical protein Q4G63_03005 [Bacteroidia bacterium]|nr:hypothetical protein [Bacteroidia bacterium]
MNTTNIKNLLEKFYRGETSPEEEKALADFLLRDNIPDEFLSDKKLFRALNETSVEVPLESSRAIELFIDSFEEKELSERKTKTLNIKYWIIGAAASLALIFGVKLFQENQQIESTLFTDTYNDPNDAYRATMDALQLFSKNFSKGVESVEKANAQLEKAQEIINKSTK